MKIYDVEQGTPEWYSIRLGKFTASAFGNLFLNKSTATYQKEIKRIAFERLTGEMTESFTNDYMERGKELEPEARQAYEDLRFVQVEQVGFVEFDEWVGCSPDGMVGVDGIIEIKCPSYSTMIDYLMDGELPTAYRYQVQGQMMITGALWCDFVAYHPSLPMMIVRVYPDPDVWAEIWKRIETAKSDVEKIINKISSL